MTPVTAASWRRRAVLAALGRGSGGGGPPRTCALQGTAFRGIRHRRSQSASSVRALGSSSLSGLVRCAATTAPQSRLARGRQGASALGGRAGLDRARVRAGSGRQTRLCVRSRSARVSRRGVEPWRCARGHGLAYRSVMHVQRIGPCFGSRSRRFPRSWGVRDLPRGACFGLLPRRFVSKRGPLVPGPGRFVRTAASPSLSAIARLVRGVITRAEL
jgi:hypothetical protein